MYDVGRGVFTLFEPLISSATNIVGWNSSYLELLCIVVHFSFYSWMPFIDCRWFLSIYAGGESIYGSVFADEFHSRLRFNHRGIVACANVGSPNSNGSQFFISLDRCDWLDRKHTIFGKVKLAWYFVLQIQYGLWILMELVSFFTGDWGFDI